MTTLPYSSATHAPKRNYPPSRGRAGRARRRCVWCGCQLPVDSKALTCSPSCRSQLSRRKRQQADATCMVAFDWRRGEGEALIQRYGLPLMEQVLNMRGWHWQPAARGWAQMQANGRTLTPGRAA